jgi:hypothetical protein
LARITHRTDSSPVPQFQQSSNEAGFSSPQEGQRMGGPVTRVRKYVSISSRARGASSSRSTQSWGSAASIGNSPAMLEAFALKMRLRTPRSAR